MKEAASFSCKLHQTDREHRSTASSKNSERAHSTRERREDERLLIMAVAGSAERRLKYAWRSTSGTGRGTSPEVGDADVGGV